MRLWSHCIFITSSKRFFTRNSHLSLKFDGYTLLIKNRDTYPRVIINLKSIKPIRGQDIINNRKNTAISKKQWTLWSFLNSDKSELQWWLFKTKESVCADWRIYKDLNITLKKILIFISYLTRNFIAMHSKPLEDC